MRNGKQAVEVGANDRQADFDRVGLIDVGTQAGVIALLFVVVVVVVVVLFL